jgi:serine/threonine-protein kinase
MRTIGKYEVVEKIGEGGFGTIFKGFDPHIRRFVAIKSCTSGEQEMRSRFLHEAQIAGNLQHRHIVTVYDFGIQDGVPYLVQEYLSGEDLDRKIKRKDSMPLAEKLLYLIQVARGLEYAHSRGVVHRDIKPANIRILEDGTAKIMDFGIAKLADQDTGLTATGMTLGTAAYLAPEQIRGEPIDQRTDLFSWGVSAWELLSYQRPFTGQHISTVLYQILHEQPPQLRPLVPECPAEIEAIVARCLEKKPERRYPACTDLLGDIDRALRARRLSTETPLGLMVAQHAFEAAETRNLSSPLLSPAPPRPRGADMRTAAVAASPPAAGEGLVELELDTPGQSRHTPRSISTTQAVRNRGFRWGRWAAAVTGVVLAGALGVMLLQGSGGGTAAADEAPPAEGGAEGAPDGRGISGEGGVAARAAPDGSVTTLAALPAPTATPATAPTATPTPPPSPRPAYVVVPAAWSPDVAVSLRGQRRRGLGETQRIAVAAGVPVTLTFEYRSGEYTDRATRTVTVAEGVTVEVENPLAAPAQVQVQQRLGTPLGRVWLDGRELGVGRVTSVVKPGDHRLRVEPANAPGSPIERGLVVPPGRKLILTFDLTSGSVVEVVADLP